MSIKITIDNKQIECLEGEYILKVARANNIFIPAICYLNRCSPTLACRLCLVEADGKQVFACNAKTKDGMVIVTNSEEIKAERKAIMQTYDVNHPLECGVCDKSGSCELQNYTLEVGVDKQEYAVCDTYKPVKEWGIIRYDPSLCIVCERCVTACGDLIGDKAISTVARGGNELNKDYKESMPKNAFAVWQKANKSLIGIKSGADKLDCTLCGECVAVCPVGAMTSAHFSYASNAWELKKIPSSCAHCSSACHLYYEVKHESIAKHEPKIYRVTNEWNFQTLCGAGRYGFDFVNTGIKDEALFQSATDALKKADVVKFNGFITNEEAVMLQTLKQTSGIKLNAPKTLAYKKFLDAYSSISGNYLYSADTQTIRDSNFIVSVGSYVKNDAPGVRFAINNAVSNKCAFVYFHPIVDNVINNLGKTVLQLNHVPNAEEAVLILLLQIFVNRDGLDKNLLDYLAKYDTKISKTVVEKIKRKIEEVVTEKTTNENGEEIEIQKTVTKEIEESVSKEIEMQSSSILETLGLASDSIEKITNLYAKKDALSLVLGSDLYFSDRASQIAKLAAMLEKFAGFKVLIIPPETNSLGVSLICDLDEDASGYCVGYNESGDFVFSAKQNFGNIAIPSLNQQEGTFTSIDKRVVKLNPALSFNGYELNDFMGANKKEHQISWTDNLPLDKGYQLVCFDSLKDGFLNDGTCLRGYILNDIKHEIVNSNIEEIALGEFNYNIYFTQPVNGFGFETYESKILDLQDNVFVCSSSYASVNALTSNDKLKVCLNGFELNLNVYIDSKLDSNICLIFASNSAKNCYIKYPFASASIVKE